MAPTDTPPPPSVSHSHRVPWPMELLLLACLCGSGLLACTVTDPGPHRAAGARLVLSGSTGMSFWWAEGVCDCWGVSGSSWPSVFQAHSTCSHSFCHFFTFTVLSYKLIRTYMCAFLHMKIYRSLSVEKLAILSTCVPHMLIEISCNMMFHNHRVFGRKDSY